MSEPDGNNPLPLAKWVKASVVGEEPAPPTREPESPLPSGPSDRAAIPPLSDDELAAAKWFSIAFLVVIIPLGLMALALMAWGSITFLR